MYATFTGQLLQVIKLLVDLGVGWHDPSHLQSEHISLPVFSQTGGRMRRR